MLVACGDFWEEMGANCVLFTGSYRRALDDKLRLPIPRPLRERIPEGSPVYVSPGLDGCVAVYAEVAFTALADRLTDRPPARVEDLEQLVRLSVSAMEHFNAFTREFASVLRELTDAQRLRH